MTADDFTSAALAILRTSIGWQSAIARLLDVDNRHVRRWIQKGETPLWVYDKIKELIATVDICQWPRDQWVIGSSLTDDGHQRKYIINLMPPRFMARIVVCDDEGLPMPDEEPADVISGTVYVADASDEDSQTVLCEITWIDEPKFGEITHLIEAATAHLERVRWLNGPVCQYCSATAGNINMDKSPDMI